MNIKKTIAKYDAAIKAKKFNQDFIESYNEDDFAERFIYLTNKNRGAHCTENKLRAAYRNGDAATLIKKLDPIMYNTEN